MASSDSVPRPEPVDPVYDALFRPDDEPVTAEPVFEQVLDVVIDPRLEEAAQADADEHNADDDAPDDDAPDDDALDDGAAPEPPVAPPAPPAAVAVVDTGRLFRSQGVTGNHAAVLALSSDRGGRLRTLERSAGVDLADAGPLSAEVAAVTELAPAGEEAAAPHQTARERRAPRRSSSHSAGRSARSITAGAVYIVVIGVTLLVGVANALLSGGGIGWPTGLALLASSVYCALTVRRDDDVVAIITPPIAFFVTAITAGQAFRGVSGGGLLNRAQLVFFTLADSWYWVIGSTLAATVIVLVRRRRA